jgi:hypothetical protein
VEYTGRNITYHLFTKGGWYVPLEHVGCSPTAISIMTAQSAPRSLQLPALRICRPPATYRLVSSWLATQHALLPWSAHVPFAALVQISSSR